MRLSDVAQPPSVRFSLDLLSPVSKSLERFQQPFIVSPCLSRLEQPKRGTLNYETNVYILDWDLILIF